MLKIGARSSPLSRAQVEEVRNELRLEFEVVWVETMGDRDKITSLKGMEKTNFFTKELDEMVMTGEIDAAIHSAKDLPDPLPRGLEVAWISEGLDPRDSLVFEKEPIEVVATSSVRREEAVRSIYPGCRFVDLRGTIHERLAKLGKGIDGVVIAEAALIRLQLTHLNRIILPGPTASLQGKLAIVCRANENIIFGT